MATLGKLNGSLYKITNGGTSISNLSSNSVEFTTATRDVTTKDSGGDSEFLATLRGATFSYEAIVALDAAEGLEEIYDDFKLGTAVTIVFTTAVTGDVQWTQQAIHTSLNVSAPMEDNVTITGTILGTGAVTKSNVA